MNIVPIETMAPKRQSKSKKPSVGLHKGTSQTPGPSALKLVKFPCDYIPPRNPTATSVNVANMGVEVLVPNILEGVLVE